MPQPLIVHTGKDGELASGTPDDLRALVDALAAADPAVLHFHGGLVKRATGTALAGRLDAVYRDAGATPAFFVWESGFVETVVHNLDEIRKEKIFKILLKTVLKHVVGKFTADAGAKAAGQLPYPREPELALELRKLERGTEPYLDLEPADELDETTDPERRALERELERDRDFQGEARAIAVGALPDVAEELDGSKGALAVQRKSATTLMSPEVVRELEDETEGGRKGLLSTAALIKKAGAVLVRVVRRLRAGRDHGIYVTVVEEILREYYLANVGGAVWHAMKKETADTFAADGDRGGRLFLDELERALAGGGRPEIDLVGHSTGAVFILNLLAEVDRRRQDPGATWPDDFSFRNVVFLAPACDFGQFARALAERRDLFRHFRMFAMTDEAETDDSLVPVLYPRSLLYFVSGVVERQEDGSSAFDRPIVGMERYFRHADVYDQPEVAAVRNFVAGSDRHAVWAPDDRGDGLRSNAESHGGFDDTDPADPARHTTMQSVQHLIRHGAGP